MRKIVAKVLIDSSVKSINRVYDYKVPEDMEQLIEIGKRVLVNFGNGSGREEEGIVVSIVEKSEYKRLKNIVEMLDKNSVVDSQSLSVAKWISKEYFCNAYDAIKLFLPPGTTAKFSSKKIVGKEVNNVVLIKSKEEIEEDINNNKITSGRHIRVLKFLLDCDGECLITDLMEDLNVSKAIVDLIRKNGYVDYIKVEVKEDRLEDYSDVQKTEKLDLNEEQSYIKNKLKHKMLMGEYSCNLLKGITGSGKTEVYMQLIESALRLNKGCIVLVPEIALTHQMTERFIGRFGKDIAVIHSKMTYRNRKLQWKKISEGEIKIVIGARSALFSPVQNLGLVIIDEAHDLSYKSQTTPKYDAIKVARKICEEKSSVLLLGTATPELSTYKEAMEEKIDYYTLNQRAGNAVPPKIEIVDMNMEKVLTEKKSDIFSKAFLYYLEDRIKKGEQTIVFLNRRGHSTYIRCKECNQILKCPNCDVSLTYHQKSDLCICHYCSYVTKPYIACPICSAEDSLEKRGIGVQKIEEELKRIYGEEITTLRMDADSTMVKDGHKKILDDFKNNNINVLIGTQMISKGHDIPNVTLVCIVDADSMININECQAGERAFSNMLQVAGRAGRKDKKGLVIVQTEQKDSYVIKALEEQSYEEMYKEEIMRRKILEYPPFCDLIQIDVYAENIVELQKASERLNLYLEKASGDLYKVNKSIKPFIQKVKNKYRLYTVIKCDLNDEITKRINYAIKKFEENEKFNKVRISITRNPSFVG